MKKQFLTSIKFAIALLVLASCKKEKDVNSMVPEEYAQVSLHNIAIINNYGASKTQKPVDVFVDNQKINGSGPISYPGTVTGIYVGMKTGSHAIAIKDTAAANPAEYYAGTINVEAGKSYSVFAYDSLTSGKVKSLFLPNDRTLPASGANIRFLNFSMNAGPVDVWLFTGTTDSVKVYSAVDYVGSHSSTAGLETFKAVNAGTYTLRARAAGTNTNIASLAVTVANPKIYTFFLRGLTGTGKTPAAGITSVLHN